MKSKSSVSLRPSLRKFYTLHASDVVNYKLGVKVKIAIENDSLHLRSLSFAQPTEMRCVRLARVRRDPQQSVLQPAPPAAPTLQPIFKEGKQTCDSHTAERPPHETLASQLSGMLCCLPLRSQQQRCLLDRESPFGHAGLTRERLALLSKIELPMQTRKPSDHPGLGRGIFKSKTEVLAGACKAAAGMPAATRNHCGSSAGSRGWPTSACASTLFFLCARIERMAPDK